MNIISKKPKLAHPLKIKQTIDELKCADLKNIDLGYLRRKIAILWEGYTQTSPIMLPSPLYRGVKWNELPKRIQDLSYPPNTKQFGRANFPDKPLFYSSGIPWAPFFELNARIGDTIALSKWRANSEILVCHVGYTPKTFESLHSNRTYPRVVPDQYKDPDEKRPSNILIENFFAEEFTKIVPHGSEHLYKLTATIAEKFLTAKPHCGLAYPAIAMRANGDNFALQPSYVEQHLKLENVEWYRVDECGDFSYKVRPLNIANSFVNDGQIEWRIVQGEHKYIGIENGHYIIKEIK